MPVFIIHVFKVIKIDVNNPQKLRRGDKLTSGKLMKNDGDWRVASGDPFQLGVLSFYR